MEDFEAAHWIVALKEAEHLPLLQERFPAWAEKVEFWHVDDAPEVLALIEREIMDLAARLIGGGRTRTSPPPETAGGPVIAKQEPPKKTAHGGPPGPGNQRQAWQGRDDRIRSASR